MKARLAILLLALLIACGHGTPNDGDAAPTIDASLHIDASFDASAHRLGEGIAPTYSSVMLESYGARGDGTTNDTAAYIAAVASGRNIQLGARTYLVNGTSGWAIASITTPGQSIIGVGDASVLKTTSNFAVVDASSGAGNNVFKNFRILGNSTGTSQHGLTVGHDSPGTGQSRITVEGVVFENLGGRGLSIEYTSTSLLGPRVSNSMAIGCLYGYYIAASDYATFAGNVAYGNTTGVYIGVGNTVWTGGAISNNTTGVLLDVAGNDAHGIFAGTEINHNTTSVQANAITNGETFAGCHIYYGDINTTSGAGVRFKSSVIDADTIHAGSNTVFQACTWPMANANTVTGSPRFTPDQTLLDGTGFGLSDSNLVADGSHKIGFAFNGTRKAYVDPSHGLGYFGNSGTDTYGAIGPYVGSESSLAALYLLPNGATAGAANPAVYTDGTNVFINSTSGGGSVKGVAAGTTFTFDANVARFSVPFQLATKNQALALSNGANNNLATTTSWVRFTGPSASFSVTGFANGVDGCRLTVFNTTAQAMTIANENASSTAANRITTMTGADVVLSARTTTASFVYDLTTSRWILVGTS